MGRCRHCSRTVQTVRVLVQGQTRWRSIGRGVVAGAIVTVGVLAMLFVADRLLSSFAVDRAVALLILAAYLVAGFRAVNRDTASPLIDGALAGVGLALATALASLVLGAFRGTHARPMWASLTPFVFGAILGAIGGAWSSRRQR